MSRIGLIGLGSIGRRHLGNLLSLGCVVRGMDVSESARDRAKAEHPTAIISDRLDFTDLDALVIATPIEHHLMWVEEAIRRRLPFFVEKSIGTIEQLPRWREIAAMEDLPINQVGYMLRFHKVVETLKASGPIGGELWLRWDASSYGHRIEESSHEIDLALFFGSRATDVGGTGLDYIELGDNWLIRINDHASQYWREWQVMAHGGRLRSRAVFKTPEDLGEQMYRDEMVSFITQLKYGEGFFRTATDVAEAVWVLEVCAAVEQMKREGA